MTTTHDDDDSDPHWDDDMDDLLWAEAGGYAAGLSRPGRRPVAVHPGPDDGSDDIPF